MNTREGDERERVVRQGRAAWARLKKDKSWMDWISVGEALLVGRDIAMYQAGTNSPTGKGYAGEFSAWLVDNKLDDMDASDRAKLFKVMDELPAIEQWRSTLTRTERLKLNHPTTVWRNYQRATEIPEAKVAKPSKAETLREIDEERNDALREVDRLKARVLELEEENASLREQLTAGPESEPAARFEAIATCAMMNNPSLCKSRRAMAVAAFRLAERNVAREAKLTATATPKNVVRVRQVATAPQIVPVAEG